MLSGWVQDNSDGPLVPMVPIEKHPIPMVLLVPMVRLVPMENHPIPMVLLVTMHLIKGTKIILSCGVPGYRAIPMVHWYQWESTLFQWFYW